ncbi:PPOX class F420-dependent oxidoreductase [Kineosporia rhizophila]|uniref:PPOX class F420-dependent oxidoreductase n=1 Tax=Kineosporia TaxID=49184 RepID=UPI000B0B812E|nr:MULTISPECIES: PPOX class F420-dependent oxidoreductase [Kineosporia]MCE0540155.1 PPOX class F420-dependent oxidoreductase [Kineosporia rhizophila]GLY14343.1 PPOX class F420-dependent enzyme [Kineosporia sp. NBRC 101677]
MDIQEALAFCKANHHAVLTTLKKDGSPQMSPVTVGVSTDGTQVVISSRETAIKVKHLRRDPRAWLAVFTDGFYGEWVQVAGPVEIVGLPAAMPLLVDYYKDISGEHPDWDEYRAVMEKDQRVIIRITPTEVGPNVSG